jgi:hypothetical protein
LLGAIVVGGGYSFYRSRKATTNEHTSDVSPKGGTYGTNQPEANASPAEAKSTNSNQLPAKWNGDCICCLTLYFQKLIDQEEVGQS